jgi:AraC-like DNA-binding protein
MDDSPCILHIGAVDGAGKGIKRRNGKLHKAHRLAYEDAIGPIPPKMQVKQKCGNPRCINPEHLFLSENLGGKPPVHQGVNHPKSKLSEEEVMQILDYRHTYYEHKRKRKTKDWANYDPITLTSIADRFGVSPSTIQKIFRDKLWRHIGPPDEQIVNTDEVRAEDIRKDRRYLSEPEIE